MDEGEQSPRGGTLAPGQSHPDKLEQGFPVLIYILELQAASQELLAKRRVWLLTTQKPRDQVG